MPDLRVEVNLGSDHWVLLSTVDLDAELATSVWGVRWAIDDGREVPEVALVLFAGDADDLLRLLPELAALFHDPCADVLS